MISCSNLFEFEQQRAATNLIPPTGSNSFYTVGEGRINILTLKDDPDDYKFDIFTEEGELDSGEEFVVSGDTSCAYREMTVITNTTLHVQGDLNISNGTLHVHGTLELQSGSTLHVINEGRVVFYPDSTLLIRRDSNIDVSINGKIDVYGIVNVHLSKVDQITNVPQIYMDPASIMDIDGLDLKDRPYCLTQYDKDLRDTVINVNTQGEYNDSDGRIGYVWRAGTPKTNSQVIAMYVLWGETILGDYKYSVLGYPNTEIPDLQIVSELYIKSGCTLHICEYYKNKRYMKPELYLGAVIGNSKQSGQLVVDGTIIAEGSNAVITADRGSNILITDSGTIQLKNGAIMRSTNNRDDEIILIVNGTLIIDSIEQISTFEHNQIVIGKKGKVIILNPDTGAKRVLFSTPNGLKETDLYRLFEDRIDHVEYHISANTGIRLDKYYEYYNRDFTNWYANRRLEKAIHDGLIVWEDNAFIELDDKIIPWVTPESDLYDVGRIFKCFGSYKNEKLQDVVNRMVYAGAGNITFRFISDGIAHEMTLNLHSTSMTNVYNHPLTNNYVVDTTDSGELFLKNSVGRVDAEHIITPSSRHHAIEENRAEFPLP